MFEKPVNQFKSRFSHLEIVWPNVAWITLLHIFGFYGIFLKFVGVHIFTRLFFIIYCHISGWGTTAGRHRYFSHRSYQANKLLEVILMLMSATAFEQSIFVWCRDHRLHHKHSETDADPYNSKRGFFFSHIGWFFVRKHEEVKEKGRGIDMSDLEGNPIVMFEHKYCMPLAFVLTILVPTFLPWYFWNESLSVCFFYCAMYRFTLTLHITWSVNSFAHLYGVRSYDKEIDPVENPYVSLLTQGEGFHNYHHTFPWDYKAGELTGDVRNSTTTLIDCLAWLGMATERKTASTELVEKRKLRTGDSGWHATNENFKYFLYYLAYIYVIS